MTVSEPLKKIQVKHKIALIFLNMLQSLITHTDTHKTQILIIQDITSTSASRIPFLRFSKTRKCKQFALSKHTKVVTDTHHKLAKDIHI